MVKMNQVLTVLFLASLLSITPLILSTSLRHTYLYFIFNLLIIALGAEAGLLKAFSTPQVLDIDHHHPITKTSSTKEDLLCSHVSSKSHIGRLQEDQPKRESQDLSENRDDIQRAHARLAPHDHKVIPNEDHDQNKKLVIKVVEKSKSGKIVGAVKIELKVNKCPAMPSLFFIGDDDEDMEVEMVEEEEQLVVGDLITGQELFNKAEMFIGNFYKQLKIQNEDSWSQKAF